MSINAALFQKLTTTPAVSALVGDRVYPMLLPETHTLPAVTLNRISARRVQSFDGPGLCNASYQIDIFGATFDNVRAVADAVRTTLDGFRGVVSGCDVQRISLRNEMDEFEDEVREYRVMLEFSVMYRE